MDFQSFPRKDLQALCKKNGIPANITNVAMVQKLSALEVVLGLEETLGALASREQKTPAKETGNQTKTIDASGNVQSISRTLRSTRNTAAKKDEASGAISAISTRKKAGKVVEQVSLASDTRRISRRVADMGSQTPCGFAKRISTASSKMKKEADTDRLESAISGKRRCSTRRLTTASNDVRERNNDKMKEAEVKGVKIEAITLNYQDDLENVSDAQREVLDVSARNEDGSEKGSNYSTPSKIEISDVDYGVVDCTAKDDAFDVKMEREPEVLDLSVDEYEVKEESTVSLQFETENLIIETSVKEKEGIELSAEEPSKDKSVEECKKDDSSAKENSNVSFPRETEIRSTDTNVKEEGIEDNVEEPSKDKLVKEYEREDGSFTEVSNVSLQFEAENLNEETPVNQKKGIEESSNKKLVEECEKEDKEKSIVSLQFESELSVEEPLNDKLEEDAPVKEESKASIQIESSILHSESDIEEGELDKSKASEIETDDCNNEEGEEKVEKTAEKQNTFIESDGNMEKAEGQEDVNYSHPFARIGSGEISIDEMKEAIQEEDRVSDVTDSDTFQEKSNAEEKTLESVVYKIDEIVEKLTDAVSICTKSTASEIQPEEKSGLGESIKILEASIAHYEENPIMEEKEQCEKKEVCVYEDQSEIKVEEGRGVGTGFSEKTRKGTEVKRRADKKNRKELTEMSLRQLRKELKMHSNRDDIQVESRLPLQPLNPNNSSANFLGLL